MDISKAARKDNDWFFKATQKALSNFDDVAVRAEKALAKARKHAPDEAAARERAISSIISKYSLLAGAVGAATSAPSIVPAIGGAVSAVAGTATDMVFVQKFIIEMVAEIATLHEVDVRTEANQRMCYALAAAATLNNVGAQKLTKRGSKVAVRLTEHFLKGATLQTIKALFRKLGLRFTRRAMQRFLPFGIGLVLCAGANAVFMKLAGEAVRQHFAEEAQATVA
jgi:hypothetical protein